MCHGNNLSDAHWHSKSHQPSSSKFFRLNYHFSKALWFNFMQYLFFMSQIIKFPSKSLHIYWVAVTTLICYYNNVKEFVTFVVKKYPEPDSQSFDEKGPKKQFLDIASVVITVYDWLTVQLSEFHIIENSITS